MAVLIEIIYSLEWLLSLCWKNQCEGKTVRSVFKNGEVLLGLFVLIPSINTGKGLINFQPYPGPCIQYLNLTKLLPSQLVGLQVEGIFLSLGFFICKMGDVMFKLYSKALWSGPGRQRCFMRVCLPPYPLSEASGSLH